MSNSFFRFKHFTIDQDKCAMKVTTDGCLFGAWLAAGCKHLAAHTPVNKSAAEVATHVLDIGAGTGLLSLMYAQLHQTHFIDAVELDASAARQAKENVAGSPWPNAIHVQQQNIIYFKPGCKYDVIVSNPPFYEHYLKGSNTIKNTAHHSSHLSLELLFSNVNRLLKPNGLFFVLLPAYRTNEALMLAQSFSLFPQKNTLVKQSTLHPFFRTMLLFSREKTSVIPAKEIVIETQRGQYSAAFIALLQPYYLYL